MDELIRTTIANKVFDKDQYGQIHIREYIPARLFNDKTVCEQVIKYLESNQSKVYRLSTYGGNLGIFKAINKI